MSLYKNAFYWFLGLLALTLVGFWQSYFSKLDSVGHFTHHFHGIAMLLWVILLIVQSWLIRNGERSRHRLFGKLSFAVAPAVLVSGVLVVFYSQGTAKEPLAAGAQSIMWFGLFSAGLYALLYAMAIKHRKNVQLHARYMVATALVFIVPGLSRTVFNYLAPLGIWVPTFYMVTWVPFLIGIRLMLQDWRNSRKFQPYFVFNCLWAINLFLWVWLPSQGWWNAFSAWVHEVAK